MVTFDSLLGALYEIQGLSDPNQPDGGALDRLAEIFELASEAMQQSGYQPPN